jgi:hypothetical protein
VYPRARYIPRQLTTLDVRIIFNLKNAHFLGPAVLYVFYRTPNPDAATVQKVQQILQQIGIDYNQLQRNTADHCPAVISYMLSH